jgi:hypothetical protein
MNEGCESGGVGQPRTLYQVAPAWHVTIRGQDLHHMRFSVTAYFERLLDALDYIKLKAGATQVDSVQVVRNNHTEQQDKDAETTRSQS